MRPTRGLGGQPYRPPIWSCSRWGLPCRRLLPAARCALTAPFHPYQRQTAGGLLSVALAIGSRLPGVTWHPALWSPDFPPVLRPAIAWPTPLGRINHFIKSCNLFLKRVRVSLPHIVDGFELLLGEAQPLLKSKGRARTKSPYPTSSHSYRAYTLVISTNPSLGAWALR